MLSRRLSSLSIRIYEQAEVPLHLHQLHALTSLAYNIGLGSLMRSTLWKKLNRGDYKGAAKQFPRWAHVNGYKLAGLKRRRLAEQTIFEGRAPCINGRYVY